MINTRCIHKFPTLSDHKPVAIYTNINVTEPPRRTLSICEKINVDKITTRNAIDKIRAFMCEPSNKMLKKLERLEDEGMDEDNTLEFFGIVGELSTTAVNAARYVAKLDTVVMGGHPFKRGWTKRVKKVNKELVAITKAVRFLTLRVRTRTHTTVKTLIVERDEAKGGGGGNQSPVHQIQDEMP